MTLASHRAPRRALAAAFAPLLGLPVLAGAGADAWGRSPADELAKGRFLVASRQVNSSSFSQSVVLLLGYDAGGALGLVVNQPTSVTLASVLPEVEELEARSDKVYVGGPVSPHHLLLLVRAEKRPEESDPVFADVYFSTSLDTLRAISKTTPPERLRAYSGYAGWAPGQLEGEIARGDWFVVPGDAETVFEKESSEIWQELIDRASGLWVRLGPTLAWLPRATCAPRLVGRHRR